MTTPSGSARTPSIEAIGVEKSFDHVRALRGANFQAFPGEVTALVGDNGAGKSTLIKILAGTLQPDAGEILVDGKTVTLTDPVAATALGIETVYQDLALAADLDAAACAASASSTIRTRCASGPRRASRISVSGSSRT